MDLRSVMYVILANAQCGLVQIIMFGRASNKPHLKTSRSASRSKKMCTMIRDYCLNNEKCTYSYKIFKF